MKWNIITKTETGGEEVHYIDTGEFNRVVEVSLTKKRYLVQCYKNDLISSLDSNKSFKTLPAAKKHGEKWITKEIKKTIKDLEKIMEAK